MVHSCHGSRAAAFNVLRSQRLTLHGELIDEELHALQPTARVARRERERPLTGDLSGQGK
jgi:hypothetical protein